MRVILKSYNGDQRPGDVGTFDDTEADRLVAVGGARYLSKDEETELAEAEQAAQVQAGLDKVAADARKALLALSVPDLKALAIERKVDIGTAKTSADIIAALDLAAAGAVAA